MNSQGKQIVINAINKVISSSPQPYNQNMFSNKYDTNPNDISKQQFEIWAKYVTEVLDISYSNLGLFFIMETNIKITQLILQFNQYNQFNENKIPYMQLVFQIKNELLGLIQTIVQF